MMLEQCPAHAGASNLAPWCHLQEIDVVRAQARQATIHTLSPTCCAVMRVCSPLLRRYLLP